MKTLCGLFSIILFFSLTNAQAYDLVSSPYLFGDWGGTRTSLANEGIVFNLGYGSELAHNFSGGTQQITDYTDQFVFGVGFDFEKMGYWKGGSFQITMTDRNGKNLGADAGIGNDMLIQEVYGRGQTLHMTDFWYNQKFSDDLLEWKAGRLTIGEDFASFSCDFQNLSFCGSQPGNIVGSYWINWPTSVWATNFRLHSDKETTWAIGAYQVNPTYVSDTYAQQYGWTLDNPSGSNGTLVPVEFAWTPKFQSQPGSYKIGAWYNTAKMPNLANPLVSSNPFGVYINFQQQLTGTETDPGLLVFLNVSQADQTTAAVDRQISLGTQYHGPFGRHDDSVALALGWTDNNSYYANYLSQQGQNLVVGSGNEFDSELYYSYAPITALFLRPNFQYIMQPGGTTANSNAFVFGLKSGVTF